MTRFGRLLLFFMGIAVTAPSALQAGVFGIFGDSTAPASNVVTAQGHTATVLGDLSAASLANVDVLWALNASNSVQLADLITFNAEVAAFVDAGGVFMYHDREVADAESVLPGGAGLSISRSLVAEIDVVDNTTLVTNGPGGIINNTTLDGGNFSNHGFTLESSLPGSSTKILSSTMADQIVDFRYSYGAGHVYYSTIPLDFYLNGNSNFSNIYAPNVVAYAAELSEPAIDVVPEPASLATFGVVSCIAAIGVVRRRRRR